MEQKNSLNQIFGSFLGILGGFVIMAIYILSCTDMKYLIKKPRLDERVHTITSFKNNKDKYDRDYEITTDHGTYFVSFYYRKSITDKLLANPKNTKYKFWVKGHTFIDSFMVIK